MTKVDYYNKETRPWNGPRMYYGAIIGHTTSQSAKIWLRVRYEGDYSLILTKRALTAEELDLNDQSGQSALDALADIIVDQSTANFNNAQDRSHVFELTDLEADNVYYYYLIAHDENADNTVCIGRETTHTFKTLSTNDDRLSFGLYSCHDPYKQNSGTAMWRQLYQALKETQSDFVIGGGDQIYVDSTKSDIWKWLKKYKNDVLELSDDEMKTAMLSWYQDVYRGYWGFPDVKAVHRSIPNYMIWDDHEIMDGWGSRTRSELADELDTWYEWENSRKNLKLADRMFEAAKIVYEQYQHSHNPTTAEAVYDFSIQPKHASVYFLDMRGYREFDLKVLKRRDGQNATDRILGRSQWQRFKSWMQAIPDQTKVIYIVSPVPVVHWSNLAVNSADVFGAKDDLRDEWDHETNHRERDKMLTALFTLSHSRQIPVVFLSGDVHLSAVFRLTHQKYRQARVFQVTASPLTRPPVPEFANIILSHQGYLKTGKKDSDFRYQRLGVLNARNFCILESHFNEDETLTICAKFYGEGIDQDDYRVQSIGLV